VKRIESYSFGRIVIDGQSYTKDVIILPERVLSPWWRKEGHYLQMEDLVDVLEARPEVLIIGKGYSGVMQVPEPVVRELSEQGMEVKVMNTAAAVDTFNNITGRKAAALHLTC